MLKLPIPDPENQVFLLLLVLVCAGFLFFRSCGEVRSY